MKKFENLGRSLSKKEQMQIFGGTPPQDPYGEGKTICTCDGSNMDTIVCSFHSLEGAGNCLAGAYSYCGGPASCQISYQ